MGVGADEGVGVVEGSDGILPLFFFQRRRDAVIPEDALGEVLEVDLVDDADAGGDDVEGPEGLLAPLEEFVALAVADELDLHVAVQGGLGSGEVHLDAVVDDEVHRDKGLDDGGVGAGLRGGGAHGGEVHDEGDAGEVLEDDAGDGEGDFVGAGGAGFPVGEVADVLLGDFLSVEVAQEGLQDNADGDGEAGDVGAGGFLEGGQGVEGGFGAVAGGEGAEGVHFRNQGSGVR